ncbi:MAG: DUF1186 domain-containing protein [Planctomycetes bacterium]|nr:DUF1186 domain-containing protein [Planctomycetota bacterium]
MQVQEILQGLEYNNESKFPRRALEAAIEQREEITPHLLEVIERAGADLEGVIVEEYILDVFAMLLLAQFREPRAYRPLLNLFARPETSTLAANLTGSMVTEELGRALASVCGGDIEPIKEMIENPELYEYTRSAGFDALRTLVNCGEVPRDDVMAYLKGLFHGGLEREQSYVWVGLVDCCLDLYPEEVLEEIAAAYDAHLVDSFCTSPRDVCQSCREGKQEVLDRLEGNPRYQPVEDVVAEMEWWACFNPPPRPRGRPKKGELKRAHSGVMSGNVPLTRPGPTPAAPVMEKKEKIGRNSPCPCGSGKKYKKCCGG